MVVTVSDKDFDKLSCNKWYALNGKDRYYAARDE